MSSANLKYYSQLDGLRAFAIIMVMIGHWIAWDTENPILKNSPWGHGVILFFVLSGYLISNILFELKENINAKLISTKQALKTFYIRRFLRIFPLYYLLIFYLYTINFANTREIFPWLVTYTSNILQAKTGAYIGDFNHFWSLAVEEQFYLIWPFLVLFVNGKKVMKIIVAIMIISFLSRLSCFFISKENWMLGAYFTPNLFLPLALGALLSYAKRYKPSLANFFNNPILLYFGVVAYSIVFYVFHFKLKIAAFDILFDEYLYAFVCVFIICRASSNKFTLIGKAFLEHDIVVFTGKISYGLYIYHLFVINFFWNYLALEFKIGVQDKNAMWFAYFVIAYVMAIISYYFIENPMNSLKKYFNY